MREHERRAFDQNDARLRWINAPEIAVQTVRVSSAKELASSTPVGPPPTTTIAAGCRVQQLRIIFSLSNASKMRLRMRSASSSVFRLWRERFPFRMAEVAGLAAHCHTIVVVQRSF